MKEIMQSLIFKMSRRPRKFFKTETAPIIDSEGVTGSSPVIGRTSVNGGAPLVVTELVQI
jgi:hypothetical protein